MHYEDSGKTEVYNCEYEGNGLQYELEHFIKKIKGKQVVDVVTNAQSIEIAYIMERFLEEEKYFRKS